MDQAQKLCSEIKKVGEKTITIILDKYGNSCASPKSQLFQFPEYSQYKVVVLCSRYIYILGSENGPLIFPYCGTVHRKWQKKLQLVQDHICIKG